MAKTTFAKFVSVACTIRWALVSTDIPPTKDGCFPISRKCSTTKPSLPWRTWNATK